MQRYFSNVKNGDYFVLKDDDIRHITLVMRLHDGDMIEVVHNELVYLCCLENVKSDIKIRVKSIIESNKNSIPKVCLIIPVLRETKMDLVIQKATELGVAEIIPVLTNRSNIRVDTDNKKKIIRWMRIAKEASEQSKRVDIPKIHSIENLKNIEALEGINLVCSTVNKENKIKMILQKVKSYDKINVVIGPEGGLTVDEENLLNTKGFISVSLGDNILRVETVPIFLLSVINYELWSDGYDEYCEQNN